MIILTGKEGERLARVETKLDTLTDLIKGYFEANGKLDGRLRAVERNNAVLMTAGGAAWAVILLIIARVFAKLF